MRNRYVILLALAGVAWFLVAGVLGSAVPVLGSMWFQHSLCAILTAFVVGFTFKGPILRWSGWRWYLLPLLTLLVAAAVFGFLVPCAWLITELFRGGGVDSEAFYKTPLMFVFYSMTFYLVILYPLALLTQHLLRKIMGTDGRAEQA
jgi:hypothetical protein